ncbi:MAG: hypothetical protein WA441_13195 [Methyloceanibacter sp.]
MMGLLKRISFLPFVLYRMALGGFLLLVYVYGVRLPPVAAQGNGGPGQQASIPPVLPCASSSRA